MSAWETFAVVCIVYVALFIAHKASEGGASGDGRGHACGHV